MLAKKYKSELVSIVNPFEGIYTLEFKSLGRMFKYLPGQFMHLSIDTVYDGIGQWPDSRCFSMQSEPNEETIRITYSVKGSYTKLMEQMLIEGSKVWLKLPYGDLFNQNHSKKKVVFISGGTGITPFLSLFTNNSFNEYIDPSIYLGFKSREFNIYETELENINNNTHFVKLFYEDTDGLIDVSQIFREHGLESYYFISGPPIMIKSFKSTLFNNGVSLQNILTDDWE